MKFTYLIVLSILILSSFNNVKADIPVHCLKEDIQGEWVFEMTTLETKNSLLDNKCGHDSPDDPETSLFAMKDDFETDSTITLTLNPENTIKYDNGDKLFKQETSPARFLEIKQNLNHTDSTFWTMIYDEGFEMRINNHIFFTFSEYKKDGKKFQSNCAKTLVGWYQNGNTFACIKGHKKNSKSIHHESELGDAMVEGQIIKRSLKQSEYKTENGTMLAFDEDEPAEKDEGNGMRSAIIEEPPAPAPAPVVKVEAPVPEPKKEVKKEEKLDFADSNDGYNPSGMINAVIEEAPKPVEQTVPQVNMTSDNSLNSTAKEVQLQEQVEFFDDEAEQNGLTNKKKVVQLNSEVASNVEDLEKHIQEEQALLNKMKEQAKSAVDIGVQHKFTQKSKVNSTSETESPQVLEQRRAAKQRELEKNQSVGYKLYNMFHNVEELMRSEYYSLFVGDKNAAKQQKQALTQVFLQLQEQDLKEQKKIAEQEIRVQQSAQKALQHEAKIMRFQQKINDIQTMKQKFDNIQALEKSISHHQDKIMRFKEQIKETDKVLTSDPKNIEVLQNHIKQLERKVALRHMRINRFKQASLVNEKVINSCLKINELDASIQKHNEKILRFQQALNETIAANSTELATNTTNIAHESASTEKAEAKVEVDAEAEGVNNQTRKSYVVPKQQESFSSKMYEMFENVEDFMKSEYYAIFMKNVDPSQKAQKAEDLKQSFLQTKATVKKSGLMAESQLTSKAQLSMKIGLSMAKISKLEKSTEQHRKKIASLERKLSIGNQIHDSFSRITNHEMKIAKHKFNIFRLKQLQNYDDQIALHKENIISIENSIDQRYQRYMRFKSVDQDDISKNVLEKIKNIQTTKQKVIGGLRFKESMNSLGKSQSTDKLVLAQKAKIAATEKSIAKHQLNLAINQQKMNVAIQEKKLQDKQFIVDRFKEFADKNLTQAQVIQLEQKRIDDLEKSVQQKDQQINEMTKNVEMIHRRTTDIIKNQPSIGLFSKLKEFLSSEYYQMFLQNKHQSTDSDEAVKSDHRISNAFNWLLGKVTGDHTTKVIKSKLDKQIDESIMRFQEHAQKLVEHHNNVQRFKEQLAKETSTSTLQMSSQFKDHEFLAARLNKMNEEGKLTWKSEVNEMFKDMTLEEMNQYAGLRKGTVKPLDAQKREIDPKILNQDISDLPKHFTWENILKPAYSQGKCGSCFAVQALRLMEYRLKIQHQEDVELSVQHVLECSTYNQGCEGGYPYLVNKFAHDLHVVDSSCKPYKATTVGGKCEQLSCDPSSVKKIYKVSDYWNIGGAYGKCNQRDMMIEIQKNGPILASIDVDPTFMLYKEGVFQSKNEREWLMKGEQRPEWTKVGHTVMVYGWGETSDGIKYWEMQNSWGPKWGDHGKFKMLRGDDSGGVESSCQASMPYPVDLTQNAEEQEKFIKAYTKQ